MKAAPVLLLIAVACAATGCGQKGPLVLPDAEHPRKKAKFPAAPKSGSPVAPAAPVPAPAAPAPAPGAPATAPSAPAGPSSDPAPPEAVPGSDPTPDAAPQS